MNGLNPAQLVKIRNRLAERCGLYLDESRVPQLVRAVTERMALHRLADLAAYERLLYAEGGAAELQQLAELLVNHETFFFRNRPHFRALRDAILPELHRRYPAGRPIRCWSAGCSTGEEPYSLAMTALEVLGNPLARTTRIWASDISGPALARAESAVYRGRSLSNVTAAQLATYFQPVGENSYRVRPEVRSLITFHKLNLLDPFPAWTVGLDLIFCQNVTIYFQLATSRQLISRFYDALADGGYLFLGFSETLWGIFDRFETVEFDGAFAYRKGEQRRPQSMVIKPQVAQTKTQRPAPERPASALPKPRDSRSGAGARSASSPRPAAPTLPPGEVAAILERARALRADGQQTPALEELRRVPPDAAEMPAVLALVAWLHADLGQREQAAAEARRALELDVLQEEAHLLLGVLDMQSGSWADAASHLERALYLNPSSPVTSFYVAECYRQLGRTAPATREYRNTLRKLEGRTETDLIDGVTVSWLRESCERWLAEMAPRPSTVGR